MQNRKKLFVTYPKSSIQKKIWGEEIGWHVLRDQDGGPTISMAWVVRALSFRTTQKGEILHILSL